MKNEFENGRLNLSILYVSLQFCCFQNKNFFLPLENVCCSQTLAVMEKFPVLSLISLNAKKF